MLGWGRAVCYCSIVSPVLTNKALSAPAFPTGSQRIVLSSSSLGSCESHALCECLLKAILTMSHHLLTKQSSMEQTEKDRHVQLPGLQALAKSTVRGTFLEL